LRARREEGAARAEVARLLDPDRIARIENHAGGEVESGLGARCDNDLIRRADDGARRSQIGRDHLAQRAEAFPRFVAEKRGAGIARMAGQKAAPKRGWEKINRGQSVLEGACRAALITWSGAADRGEGFSAPGEAACGIGGNGSGLFVPVPVCASMRGGRGFEQGVGRDRRNPRARADAALQIALGCKLFVGAEHRVAPDAEIGGQHARGRKARAGSQAAFEDRQAQRVVKLAVERRARPGVECGRAERQMRGAGWHERVCSGKINWLYYNPYSGSFDRSILMR